MGEGTGEEALRVRRGPGRKRRHPLGWGGGSMNDGHMGLNHVVGSSHLGASTQEGLLHSPLWVSTIGRKWESLPSSPSLTRCFLSSSCVPGPKTSGGGRYSFLEVEVQYRMSVTCRRKYILVLDLGQRPKQEGGTAVWAERPLSCIPSRLS